MSTVGKGMGLDRIFELCWTRICANRGRSLFSSRWV